MEKSLPYSLEAEQSLLGAIILDPNCLHQTISIINSPLDFYEATNQLIYSTILEMFSLGKKIDFVTLLDNLKCNDGTNFKTIKNYLLDLVKIVPSISSSSEYAQIIRNKSKYRKLINMANTMLDSLYKEENIEKITSYISNQIFEMDSGDSSNKSINVQEAAIQSLNFESSISSGFKSLDELLEIKKSNLVLIAARPGMGKTSFALKMASNMSKYVKVLFFSLEMSAQQLAMRLLNIESGVPFSNIKTGNLSCEQWNNLKNAICSKINKNIIIDDNPNSSVNSIKTKAKLTKDVGAIFIDYLQLINTPSSKHENRTQEISYITRNLKLMAKELDAPVICLSQLSRSPEQRSEHRPVISDLRDSGSIEQDADSVMMLYRPGYYSNDEKIDPNECECIISKNRFGQLSTVKLTWNPDCTQFSES